MHSAVHRDELVVLIWDFDGTIADTTHAIQSCIGSALESADLPTADPLAIKGLIGLSIHRIFEELTSLQGSAIDELVEKYRLEFKQRGPHLTGLYPGIEDLLFRSGACGKRSAIATSKGREGVELMLDKLGITSYFDLVVSDDDVQSKKPHPEMVNLICGKFNVTPDKALVIGDTVFDIQMGKQASAFTCGVTWGNQSRAQLEEASPDTVVDSVVQLSEFCLG